MWETTVGDMDESRASIWANRHNTHNRNIDTSSDYKFNKQWTENNSHIRNILSKCKTCEKDYDNQKQQAETCAMWEKLAEEQKLKVVRLHGGTHQGQSNVGYGLDQYVDNYKKNSQYVYIPAPGTVMSAIEKCLLCKDYMEDLSQHMDAKIRISALEIALGDTSKNSVVDRHDHKLETLDFPIEEENYLFSIDKPHRQTKLQLEETIKSLNEEAEQSTEIIKQMMKIVGIKTDDFGDCTGNIFAKKCLDSLINKKEEEAFLDDEELLDVD
ncbi:MAG: hypothetical protein K2W92_07515 [Alphaproteobacteria bacterium]|nr:hypothetical protein [Alphaproteobacteria bacterium]